MFMAFMWICFWFFSYSFWIRRSISHVHNVYLYILIFPKNNMCSIPVGSYATYTWFPQWNKVISQFIRIGSRFTFNSLQSQIKCVRIIILTGHFSIVNSVSGSGLSHRQQAITFIIQYHVYRSLRKPLHESWWLFRLAGRVQLIFHTCLRDFFFESGPCINLAIRFEYRYRYTLIYWIRLKMC